MTYVMELRYGLLVARRGPYRYLPRVNGSGRNTGSPGLLPRKTREERISRIATNTTLRAEDFTCKWSMRSSDQGLRDVCRFPRGS